MENSNYLSRDCSFIAEIRQLTKNMFISVFNGIKADLSALHTFIKLHLLIKYKLHRL